MGCVVCSGRAMCSLYQSTGRTVALVECHLIHLPSTNAGCRCAKPGDECRHGQRDRPWSMAFHDISIYAGPPQGHGAHENYVNLAALSNGRTVGCNTARPAAPSLDGALASGSARFSGADLGLFTRESALLAELVAAPARLLCTSC